MGTSRILSDMGHAWEITMKHKTCLFFVVILSILLSASASMAIDTNGMARRSDSLFSRNGMNTKTVCTDQRATITLFDNPDGKRPSVGKGIDTLAVAGKRFTR